MEYAKQCMNIREPASAIRLPVDSGAQSDLIGAHEPMSIEAVLAALGGSRTRGLTPTATFGDGVAVARGGLV